MARVATAVLFVISRVALISPYALSVHGGVQEQVLAMSRELARRDVEVLIVAPDAADQATYDTPSRVVRFGPLVSIPANGSRAPLGLSVRASQHAASAVADFAPDVVHFHEPFAPLIGWRVLREHRFASVATFHRGGGGPALTLGAPLLRRLAKGLDVSVAVSELAERTIHDAARINATVLFNGFETERFRSSPRRRGDDVVLAVIGRLESRKGVDVAIRAVRNHNAKSSQPWRLVILGDGPREDASRRWPRTMK